jgi:hypothetical protein
MELRETGCEDGTGSGSCPVAGSGISGNLKNLRKLFLKMEDG